MTRFEDKFDEIARISIPQPLQDYAGHFDNPTKSTAYSTKILTALHTGDFSRGGFSTMVKSGERYSATNFSLPF